MSEADDPANKEGNVNESVEVSSVHSAGTSAPMVDLHACGICFQLYDESERLPKVLSCGHTNCLTCLNSWVKHSSSPFPVCSICRRVTRKPVNLLATNFQLLQVLRRMKLISAESKEATPDDQQQSANAADNDATALNLAAVCEQVDEHMQEVASLLEIQMEALNMNEQQNSSDQGLLSRMIENSVADLLSRWDSAKTYLLDAEKRKTGSSSSRESLSMSAAFSEISAVIYDALHDETPGLLDFMPFRVPSLDDDARVPPSESSRFDGIYDWGGESETLTHAYSDFSLFGSESHETAVSASQSSSQEETFPNFVGWEESPTFPHISTFHGPFASYSRCSLCQCRLSTSFASHQTHVSGRRHQQFIGSLTEANSSRGRRRPQSAAAVGSAHTPNSNNRSFHASATASASTRPTETVNLSLPSARRSLPHGTSDQRTNMPESIPRYGRNNRRNTRPPVREEQHQNQNQSNRNNRGSNRQNPASGWDNQEWPVIGWGQLPYEYVPGWSFGYGGYIQ
ncbi:unnamed protein product [Cylicocyclus nassatus]|uniref:RING-type domain-containing protein n=1 Tax=Cylicocyclus nassatus TaxID=53992 RepID=A0AA36DRW1_CYLNA|nr:unnamed protein product [Cylicocyclus nassatus]